MALRRICLPRWFNRSKNGRPDFLADLDLDPIVPLTHHLEELRSRIFVAFIVVIVFTAIALPFVGKILVWLAAPVGHFIFTSPSEAFFLHLKIAFFVATVCALPVWMLQAWGYVGHALKLRERTVIRTLFPIAFALFAAGGALAFFVVVPAAVHFLLAYSSPVLQPLISLSEYLSFVFWMIVGFGLFFQLPLVVIGLCRLGVVSPKTLAHYRRHVIVVIFIIAAFLTPGPDVFSQLVLAVPSYLLFEISLLISRRFSPQE
jgi:sec-independent protein translocase protein TatC